MKTINLSQIEKLEDLYYLSLLQLATRLCGSPAVAMMLTQRTFRQAFDFGRTLPVPDNSRAWLFAILFNKFLENKSHNQAAETMVRPILPGCGIHSDAL
jgi:DNA-directed RNA polymerase specialized sigma24 family protein